VYVIDAQGEYYEHALPKLVDTITIAHAINPNIHFEVFLVRQYKSLHTMISFLNIIMSGSIKWMVI
jgi:hypothetical protein